MKLVIDIPADDFNAIYHGGLYAIQHDKLDQTITEAFQTATIIPKGHGDLISREALRKAFHERIWHFDKSSWDEANAIIDNAPTIEPFERIGSICEENCGYRPQGEWIKKQVTPASCTYVCSECGIEEVILGKFCRNCGAEMKGGRE